MSTRQMGQSHAFDVETLHRMFQQGFQIQLGETTYRISLAGPLSLEDPSQTPADPPPRRAASDKDAPESSRRPAKRPARERMPDPRDVREFLAHQHEGGTVTTLAREFNVRRATMSKLLGRLAAREEVVLYRGSYYNNRRLRKRRIGMPTAAGPAPADLAAEARMMDEETAAATKEPSALPATGSATPARPAVSANPGAPRHSVTAAGPAPTDPDEE